MSLAGQNLLGELAGNNPLLNAIKAGASPAAVKHAIINRLAPYFKRQDILATNAVEILVPEFLRICRIEARPWCHEVFMSALVVYEASKTAGDQNCFRSIEQWWREVEQGISGFWSVYNLRQLTESMSLHDLAFDKFRVIGSLLEGAVQPMLRELLSQARIARGKDWNADKIRTLEFGNVVDELRNTTAMQEVCEPSPWKIRINQWRNIAQHQAFKIKGDAVVVRFGKPPKTTELTLTVEDLKQLTGKVAMLFESLGSARAIFTIDNHESLSVAPSPSETRPEGRLLHLATVFSSQGFELIDVTETSDAVDATIRDTIPANAVARGAHTMQFVHGLSLYFSKKDVRIRFSNSANSERFLFTAYGEDCEAFRDGKLTESEMANRTKIEILSNDDDAGASTSVAPE